MKNPYKYPVLPVKKIQTLVKLIQSVVKKILSSVKTILSLVKLILSMVKTIQGVVKSAYPNPRLFPFGKAPNNVCNNLWNNRRE